MINGQQTLAGSPDVELLGEDTAACCPQGVLPFAPPVDNCCIDNGNQSPFALTYSGALNTTFSTIATTVFSFDVIYKGTDLFPTPPGPIDCRASDVDQLELFLDNNNAQEVMAVNFNNSPVTFLVESDAYRSWIKVINLAWSDKTKIGALEVIMSQETPTTSLCSASVASSILCEYNLIGDLVVKQDGTQEYQCCPHGATPLVVKGCSA